MLGRIFRKIKFLKILNNTPEKEVRPPANLESQGTRLSGNLKKNLGQIKDVFEENSDINIREFTIGKRQTKAFIVNISGMSEKTMINENIMGTLMWDVRKAAYDESITLKHVKESFISINEVKEAATVEEVVDGILCGNTAFFLDGSNVALLIGTKAWEHRGVEQPQTESVVRGAREGFTETLQINTSLVRRKIKSPHLKLEKMIIGQRTRTEICIVYLKKIADDKIVEEVRRRLNAIDIDAVLESGYIEEFIEDAPLSLFPTVGNTESPDKFAAKILEGRVGILVDGTPFALTVPFLFVESLQVTEDYYSRPFFASQVRLLRFLALHITLFLPAFYIALLAFHPSVFPVRFLITVAATREGIPFPSIAEALIMGTVFEVLREAGVRMPRPVGQAVSIVGALVLGDAAVRAGIVSPPMVIVIGLTGIMSFLLPPQTDSVTMLRFPVLIIAGIFGLFGVVWSYILIIIHLASLRSFGVPYFSPIMPFNLKDLKDVFIRSPWWMMKTRPGVIAWKDSQREGPGLRPDPAKNKDGNGAE